LETEKETYLYQASKNPKFNSWVFLITSRPSTYYKGFYEELEKYGLTKQKLMEIKAGERAVRIGGIADNILTGLR